MSCSHLTALGLGSDHYVEGNCDTAEDMAALAHALPRLRMLDLCQCASFAHNAGAGHVSQDLIMLVHLQLLVAGCDNVVKCLTEQCQMSRLGQLKHLRLVDSFDECTDRTLGAALASLTGDVRRHISPLYIISSPKSR